MQRSPEGIAMGSRRFWARSTPGRLVLAVAAALAATAGARADLLLRLDPSASRIEFLLESTFHDVHGSFRLRGGEVRFDPASGEASGRVEVSAASGESGNESRDEKMHEKVLESASFPSIVFVPDRVTGSFDPDAGGPVTLEGIIEIHGTSRRLAVTAQVRTSGERLQGEARFSIPYVEWGMADPSFFIFRAKKEVEVHLHLEGILMGPLRPEKEPG